MSFAPIRSLPDEARVWIFGADRPLGPDHERTIRESLAAFLEEWTAHRRELSAGLDILHGRFVVVALDESRVPASGCSIDSLVRRLQELERRLDLTLTDSSPVWYREEEGEVASVTRGEFRSLAEAGKVDPGTSVFDLTVETLGHVRSGGEDRWERPAHASWHARLLGSVQAPQSDGSAAG